MTNIRKRAVDIYRVSTLKQFDVGNSIEEQRKICLEANKRYEHILVKEFELVETGTDKDRELFEEVLRYCKDPKNRIDVMVFKSVDRFTRAGDYIYSYLKKELAKSGVELVDAYGFIQPVRNTLAHLNIQYPWSLYSPSQNAEIMQANQAKQEVTDFLTRAIGAEIVYTRAGYGCRKAPAGFVNAKIETEMGKRVIRVFNPSEAKWFIKMFELRAEGILSDQEIVDKINELGFKTQERHRRDKRTKKVIGYLGKKPLTVKQFQRYIKNPVYAGFIYEKWTDYQPVKAQFDGLVDIDTFNKANRGKIMIVKNGENYRLLYNQKPYQTIQRKDRNNPAFPFKDILCPKCNNPLLGSAPRSKSGKHIGYYHCGRNHKYWGVNKKTFDETIYRFIGQIKFTQDFIRLFKEVVLDVWNNKKEEAFQNSIDYGQRVEQLKQEKQLIKDKIRALSSSVAIKTFEEDLETTELQIALAIEKRDQHEQKEVDIEELVVYANYFMEHLSDLLIVPNNPLQQKALFSLLFESMPTYEDITNGTLKLSQCFELNQQKTLSKSLMVSPEGFEPPTTCLKGTCSAIELWARE